VRTSWSLALITGLSAAVVSAGGAAHAVAGGAAEEVPLGFVARVTVHDAAGFPVRGCSGALVERQWVITAAHCLGADTSPPPTVTVGTAERPVTTVVRHPERDVAVVRMATAETTVEPVRLGATPSPGEVLRVAGWRRTATEWVPSRPHHAQFRVDAVGGHALDLVSATGAAALCRGDAGGPLIRGGEVVALATGSSQRNCLDAPAETRDAAQAVAVGDLSGWLLESISAPVRLTGTTKVEAGRFTAGDARPDVVATETSTGKLWLYPGTAAGHVLDRRVEIGSGGWNGISRTAAGDFTADGRTDLAAVESSTGKLFLYPNTGGTGLGIFAPRTEIGSGGWNGIGRIVGGDLDGNGRADLMAVETATGKLFSYLNTGRTGLDMLATRMEIGGGGWQTMAGLTAEDFTGDGHRDVFAVADTSGVTWVYPGDGTGTSDVGTRTEVRLIG
jgi:hypothetical protein